MSDQTREPTRQEPFAMAIIATAAIWFLGCLLVWAAAQLTSLVSHHRWQGASLSRSSGFALRLLSGNDVDRAWGSTYPHATSPGP